MAMACSFKPAKLSLLRRIVVRKVGFCKLCDEEEFKGWMEKFYSEQGICYRECIKSQFSIKDKSNVGIALVAE